MPFKFLVIYFSCIFNNDICIINSAATYLYVYFHYCHQQLTTNPTYTHKTDKPQQESAYIRKYIYILQREN